MSDKHTIRLIGPTQREHAARLAMTLPDNYVGKFAPETRTDRQNRKLHAMLRDVRRDVPDMRRFSTENAKLRFMDALDMEVAGHLPQLDGEGFFPVGTRTRDLTVEQFNALIALVEVYGAERGVRWTDPETRREALEAA